MISMGMSLQNVLTAQCVVFNEAKNSFGAVGGNFCGRLIKIQHGINDRAYPRDEVMSYKWVDPITLERLIAIAPDQHTEWLKIYFREHFDALFAKGFTEGVA